MTSQRRIARAPDPKRPWHLVLPDGSGVRCGQSAWKTYPGWLVTSGEVTCQMCLRLEGPAHHSYFATRSSGLGWPIGNGKCAHPPLDRKTGHLDPVDRPPRRETL